MIFSIQRDWGNNAPIVRIVTDSTREEIVATGWLGAQEADIERANNGPFEWQNNDTILVNIIDKLGNTTYSNLFTPFPDHRSINPIAPILPNLQNITAHAGGGQANATQLNIGINVVTSVATAEDSVVMPDDVLGETVIISNRGANQLALYPFLGDSIDQLSTNSPIYIFPGETYLFYGVAVTNWAGVNISPVYIVNQNIVAHAGGGQANATVLNVGLSVVTTVATAGDSVKISPNNIGQTFVVVNVTGNNLDIFPPVGSNFAGLGTNAALTLTSNNMNIIIGATSTELFYK